MKTIKLPNKVYEMLLEKAKQEGYDEEILSYYIMKLLKEEKKIEYIPFYPYHIPETEPKKFDFDPYVVRFDELPTYN